MGFSVDSLCLDLCINNWRIDLEDFLRSRVLDEGWASVLLWRSAESESGWERWAAREASRAAASLRPFLSGPRNWEALCRQVEKPSWKECFWPCPLPHSKLALLPVTVFCRKRTVCSSISAFSTLRWVASCVRNKELKQKFFSPHWQAFKLRRMSWQTVLCVFTCCWSKRAFRFSRLRLILSLRRLSTWGLRLYETRKEHLRMKYGLKDKLELLELTKLLLWKKPHIFHASLNGTGTFLLAFASSGSWSNFMIVFQEQFSGDCDSVGLWVKAECDHWEADEGFYPLGGRDFRLHPPQAWFYFNCAEKIIRLYGLIHIFYII